MSGDLKSHFSRSFSLSIFFVLSVFTSQGPFFLLRWHRLNKSQSVSYTKRPGGGSTYHKDGDTWWFALSHNSQFILRLNCGYVVKKKYCTKNAEHVRKLIYCHVSFRNNLVALSLSLNAVI